MKRGNRAQLWPRSYCQAFQYHLDLDERSNRGELGVPPRVRPPGLGSIDAGARRCWRLSLQRWDPFRCWRLGGLAAIPASAATPAPSVAQCNPPEYPITAGFEVTCDVTVDNYTSASGATNSTVTTTQCLGAAGVVFPSCPLSIAPVTSTVNSSQLVTSVNQCNGIVTGGGSNVYCNVTVTNHVPAGTQESGVTVDQCIGSATGGGGTTACAPTREYDQCHGDAVQRLGHRRRHVCRRADRRLHRDGRSDGGSRNGHPVQQDSDRWWQRSDVHGHVR